MVSVINVNYNTRCYEFSIDTDSDLELLPKYGISGKEKLNTISSCSPGSVAIQTNGNVYRLNGDSNTWIKSSSSSGGGGNSGSDGGFELPDGYEFATGDDMDNIFGV